jgi:predicted DNA-binding transcriptional regulator YafY
VDFSDEAEARFIVLGLGAGVEVVEPVHLRDQVAAEIAAMAARR